MRILKSHSKKEETIGENFSSIFLDLDYYPDETPACCFISKDEFFCDLMYIGEKEFKLLSINGNYSKGVSSKYFTKGTYITQYDCSSGQA